MACSRLSFSNKELLKCLKVLINHQSKQKFHVSVLYGKELNEKNVYSSYHTTSKGEIEAAASLATQQSTSAHYKPSIVIRSPNVTNISSKSSKGSSPQHFQESLEQDSNDIFNDLKSPFEFDPRTVHRVYYFDSLAFTKKLEEKGFSREQAEGCVECLLEIIGSTVEHQAKHMITKSEQKIAEQQLHTEIMSVKQDMVLLQKSEFSALRTETEKISNDISRIQTHFQDEMVKLKGQFTLDINLERGRAVEAHAANEKNLQRLDNKIETEIAHLKTTYEVYRNDIFKYAAGTVLTCTTLIIGFIRLWT